MPPLPDDMRSLPDPNRETERFPSPPVKSQIASDPFVLTPAPHTPKSGSSIPALPYDPRYVGNQLEYFELFGYPNVPENSGNGPLASSPCENRATKMSYENVRKF